MSNWRKLFKLQFFMEILQGCSVKIVSGQENSKNPLGVIVLRIINLHDKDNECYIKDDSRSIIIDVKHWL